MPDYPLFASITICEKVLVEKDDAFSLIRLADLFAVRVHPDIPIESQAVQVKAYLQIRSTSSDRAEHTFQLKVVRPDGMAGYASPLNTAQLSSKVDGTPVGLNLVAEIGVVPRFMGTHFLVLEMDGKEVAWTAFTLQPQKDDAAGLQS